MPKQNINHVQVTIVSDSNNILKSICVHLSPGSSCGLVAYTFHILAQWYIFFMGHTAGRDSGLMIYSEAYEESTSLNRFKIG